MEVNGKAKRTSLKDSKNCENTGKFFCYYTGNFDKRKRIADNRHQRARRKGTVSIRFLIDLP